MRTKSTRKHIIQYLESRQVASAQELSRALQVTAANVRHHLKNLQQDELVTMIGERAPQGRGRPTKLFRLARQGENLNLLAGMLLNELLHNLSLEDRVARLQALADRLRGEVGDSKRHISQRLYGAIQRLNTLNYQSRWEAHSMGPRIILGHCPYAAIIDDHPALCQMDAYLLEGLLREPVSQTAKLERDKRGLPYCTFVVGSRI